MTLVNIKEIATAVAKAKLQDIKIHNILSHDSKSLVELATIIKKLTKVDDYLVVIIKK